MTRPSRSALIVSDSAPFRRYAAAALKAGQFACTEAANGFQAIERLSGNPFLLYIVDLDMPTSDGLAMFAITLMGGERDPAPTIIGCTRNPKWETEPSPWSGKTFAALLAKPFRPEEILVAAAAALNTA
jgi:two-component system chemotaxis response regulator CheY